MVCCRDVRRPESPVYSFTAHEKGVSAVSFTPLVPGMLATCSEDKTVRVWDVDAETPLQVWVCVCMCLWVGMWVGVFVFVGVSRCWASGITRGGVQ